MGAKNNNLKPGQTAPASGQYPVVGPRGGKTNKEVTVIKDRPMPLPRSRVRHTASRVRHTASRI
jgi:hypothetical protein